MAEFIVNTIEDDTATDDGDDSVITLREAVLKANDSAGADIITFDMADESPLIRLTQGEIEITDELVIDGGDGVIITGDRDEDDTLFADSFITDTEASSAAQDDNSRIFNITAAATTVTLEGLTLTGGVSDNDGGGAILSDANLVLENATISGNTGDGVGAGIRVNSTITVNNSTISENYVTHTRNGGGIYSTGITTIDNSTISGNASGGGGGIYSSNAVYLTNSTISGNAGAYGGGGIFAFGGVSLVNSTISGNTAEVQGTGGIEVGAGPGRFLDLINSIVLGNTGDGGDEIDGPGGYRVNSIFESQDPAEVFAQTIEFDPVGNPGVLTGVLADNGGPTKTIQILADGLAHNEGDETGFTTDQRGGPRVVGGTVDIGAVELNRGLTAMDDSAATDSDDVATGLLLTNDRDEDGDRPIVGAVNGAEDAVGNEIRLPSGALLLVNENGEFTYNPNGVFDDVPLGTTETDSFEYTATDTEFEDIATVTLTIAGQAEQSSTGGGDEGGGGTTTGQGQTGGTNGPDMITCQDGNNILSGLKGRDTICGGQGDDTVLGGSGRDRLNGAAGDDLMRGAKGNDLMSGGKGKDTLLGGEGHDKTFGLAGEDELRGGSGNDTVKGGGGSDELHGGLDHDLLMGGNGDDNLFGGAGNDILHGGSGNDMLFGGAGDDSFHFEQGRDHVHGGTGEDALIMEGDLDDYDISFENGEVHVQRGDDMTTAVNIETLRFDDAVHLVDDLRALF